VHAFYGDSHILHGVSFSLQPGGVLALLGRNGAGKTTCISTIIGFLKPRGGEIRLFGEPIEGLSLNASRSSGLASCHKAPHLLLHGSKTLWSPNSAKTPPINRGMSRDV
jgi:ABC-type branched-subunit amino acid transport system ATPase component